MHLVAASTHDFAPMRIEPARTHCTYDTRAAYSEALSTWADVGPATAPSAGVMDLRSLAILELSTYTPNGARENLYVAPSPAPLEPMGFTGKESDEELGMTYFGERWLIPRLGRWASPDPLHVHASGGGQPLSSFHDVSGNLLQARDPLGLDIVPVLYRFSDDTAIQPSGQQSLSPRISEANRAQLFSDAAAMVHEMQELIVAEHVARAASLMDMADRGELDIERAVSLAGQEILAGHAEASAVSFNERTGRIDVADVYPDRSERSRGGSVYERLLFVATDDRDVTVGFRRPEQIGGDIREAIVTGDYEAAGYSLNRAGHNLPPPAGQVWVLPLESRGGAFSEGGPRDTVVHELIIHTYRDWTGLDPHHGGCHGPGACTGDSDADLETHWLWSFDIGEDPPIHTHEGAPPQASGALPRLSGPQIQDRE